MGSAPEHLSMGDAPFTALVVGTDEWAEDQAARALQAAGLAVLRCHEPGAPPFPCNAFIEGRTCPLDQGIDVVLTARARPSRAMEPSEFGVVCALRAGYPLVVAGATTGSPFGTVASRVVEV